MSDLLQSMQTALPGLDWSIQQSSARRHGFCATPEIAAAEWGDGQGWCCIEPTKHGWSLCVVACSHRWYSEGAHPAVAVVQMVAKLERYCGMGDYGPRIRRERRAVIREWLTAQPTDSRPAEETPSTTCALCAVRAGLYDPEDVDQEPHGGADG